MERAVVWIGDNGVERSAVFEPRDDSTAISYCWRTLRKDTWCEDCNRALRAGAEVFAHDWETRWCVPCAVKNFEFVYWDTVERREARLAREAERWRRINDALGG